MIRPELHAKPAPDRLSAKPRKHFLDAIAWRAAHPDQKQLVAIAQRMRAYESGDAIAQESYERRSA